MDVPVDYPYAGMVVKKQLQSEREQKYTGRKVGQEGSEGVLWQMALPSSLEYLFPKHIGKLH